jgi:microsomal dipeptidase-like Zn-dependent dipeptidase
VTEHAIASGCYALEAIEPGGAEARYLVPTNGGLTFGFATSSAETASRFALKPSDLATYLFYDAERRYVVVDDGPVERRATLVSDILLVDDTYVSGAEWEVAPHPTEDGRFTLEHHRTGRFLAVDGRLVDDPANAAAVGFHATEGCAEHPELSVDAEGQVVPRTFDDGSVFGIVDTHSHMFTNFGFGGGGILHGAPFHRLGVEHALPDCSLFHGDDGRSDLLGYTFNSGLDNLSVDALLPALLAGYLPEFDHHTAGYPDFTDWPAAPFSSTHQTQYYRWLERAYLGGLRLVVQHATTNSALCDLVRGQGVQATRYECNDMIAVDRSIAEAYNLERYVDAHAGGPGLGWFRIVKSAAEARDVIGQGKLAVILGIEVSNLFDCFLVPPEGFPACDEKLLIEKLERYHALGVRALFPVHKYDNAFSPGDGHRTISELGNFANSGHWSNFTLDCPADVNSVFDRGNVQFGALNKPRDDYFAPTPNDMSTFPKEPVPTIAPFLDELQSPPLEGDYCQNHGMTPLGETLLREMMRRGMIVEIDHLPRWSYKRAFELLSENGYPAAATHGTEYGGKIYENGGISKTGVGRCADANNPGGLLDSVRNRKLRIEQAGGYPGVGFGFDLNGFAGAPGPRFGERSGCDTPQENPVEYPFKSFAGDVTFTKPRLGTREVDFNTEGLTHIGMLPELLEDARRTGTTDAELETVFRSAESYLRMWERAEERSSAIP